MHASIVCQSNTHNPKDPRSSQLTTCSCGKKICSACQSRHLASSDLHKKRSPTEWTITTTHRHFSEVDNSVNNPHPQATKKTLTDYFGEFNARAIQNFFIETLGKGDTLMTLQAQLGPGSSWSFIVRNGVCYVWHPALGERIVEH